MKAFSCIFASLVLALLSSCTDHSTTHGEDASVIENYLGNVVVDDEPHLKIRYDAIGHDFMLYGAFIPMLNSPTGHSLKGRIVRFKVTGDRLIMLESPKGHSLGDADESIILLADFPIVKKDDDGVVIDFAKGMNSVFTMRNVHSRAVADREAVTTAEQFRAITLSASFVREIVADNGVLTVSQIAQWRNQKSELVSAEFRYYFREYLPSKTYQKRTFGKHRWVQYFTTPPLVASPTSNAFAFITKWDIDKPIIFYLSSNTPTQYREAIVDGLTFWNHIFGKNIIEVRDLDPKLSAPHPKLNILQWVTWDNEASAYADMVVDHLTGEVLQAQIYLRSGWVIESARKLKIQLEELIMADHMPESLPVIEEDVPLPSMFDLDEPCEQAMDGFDELGDLAKQLSESKIKPELLTILTGDILRAVISHEMGHVLGLRHNLAASTQGSLTLHERDQVMRSYLQSGRYELPPEKFFSRSIMDVFSAGDDALVGAQIRELMRSDDAKNSRLRSIYRYDEQALDFGYKNKDMVGDMVFCTDDDIPLYIDCRRWDASGTSLEFAANRLNSMMSQIAIIMADTFIAAIDPKRNGGPLRVKDISLTSRNVLKVVEGYAKELYGWLSKNSRSAFIETNHSAFGPQTEKEITEAKLSFVRGQIEAKGVEQTLFGMLPPFLNQVSSTANAAKYFRAHFLVRLQDLTAENDNFSLSKEDQEQAFVIADAFLATLHQDIISVILSTVGKAQFDDPDFQIPIEEAIGKIANEIILGVEKADVKDKAPPQFRYDLKTRELAAQILNPALGIVSDWSFDSLQKIVNQLKVEMRRVGGTGQGGGGIDLAVQSREQRQWLLEQNRLLNTLSTMRTLTRK